MAHEIDYIVHGNEMQFVEIQLDPGESVIAEAGAMMYMDDGIRMETIFGDGSDQGSGGGLSSKLFSAGKRLITGESLFMTVFTNQGQGRRQVSFAAPYPGKIVPLNLLQYEGKVICQKDAFLCAAKGVSVGIDFKRKLGVGFFGGEGFIMQKLEGDGWAFIHAGGTILERTLEAGELLRVDTGCLVALTKGVKYDIEMVKGIKTAFLAEKAYSCYPARPGKVWLQSLPFNRLADRLNIQGGSSGRKEEGSLLGTIGNLIDGD